MITINDVQSWVDKVAALPCEIPDKGFQIVPYGVDVEACRMASEALLRTISGNDKVKVYAVMVPLLVPVDEQCRHYPDTIDGKAPNSLANHQDER